MGRRPEQIFFQRGDAGGFPGGASGKALKN